MSQPIDVHPAGRVDHIGQGTAVEQTRAVTEVLAAVEAARRFPRDPEAIRRDVLNACGIKSFAERAFYSKPQSGGAVTGPSVHLARELARAWGNISHGLTELRQNLERGESEIQAYAHDLQTNVRVATTYVVPHIRDARGARQPLARISEVYDNNASQGARRVRAAIFAVLPAWLVDEATAACRRTIEAGDGKSIEQRSRDAVAAFATKGIDADRLAVKIGRPMGEWTAQHLTDLEVLWRSLAKREITIEEAFPARIVFAALADQDAGRDPAEPAADDPWYRAAADGGEPE